ncbi:MAG: hypothetical protein Q9220_002657 [cf. Caloplaca sp. 1 TL-2023]
MPERTHNPRESWQAVAKAKVADLHSRIPKEWLLSDADLEKAKKQRDLTGSFTEQYLNNDENEIMQLSSLGVVDAVSRGRYTAVDVTRAYCKAAAVAQQIFKNNCLHEIMFDFAIQIAKGLDQYYAQNGRVIGPLHGLPISLKDQFHVAGYDTTMGYVGWIGTYEGNHDPIKVHQVDSQVVEDLLLLGAIPFCKCGETVNNIIGEAALQALRGSSVGLGTDIGGSVRIPAAFCGTYSIKPTHTRLSYRNVANSNPGQATYPSSVGVMGTDITALKLVLTSLISTCPWDRDPDVVRMPWNGQVEASILARVNPDCSAGRLPLKFGIFWTDGVVTPHPPIQRGLRIVRDALKGLGHKVVDWNPPPQTIATRIHLAILTADGAHDIHQQLHLSGEPLVPELREMLQLRDPMPLLEYQDLTMIGKAYSQAYSDYWNSTNDDGHLVDAVLMPVAPHAAVIPGKFYHTAYTQIVNLLDYSAVVIPVTTADKTTDNFDHAYQPLNEVDRKNWEACKCLHDPETYDGAPVGLQLVTRKWQEEKMKYILLIGTLLASARAVDVNGDPTDLSNYPACSQKCIPETFGPPADCGSLSNRTCICNTFQFGIVITPCKTITCSKLELNRELLPDETNTLAAKLCAPLGGIGPVDATAAESVYASTQLLIAATPTYPPSITAASQASSFLATASLVPDLGNPLGPLDSSAGIYPACAGICEKQTAAILTNPNDLAQVCGVASRTANAVCEVAVCSAQDKQTTQLLAQEACNPYYVNNATLAASVTAALTSATSIAQAVVAGTKDVKDPASYPECAVSDSKHWYYLGKR